MNWQLVEDDQSLEELLARAAGADAVVLDTEFMRRKTFYPKIALLQLCFVSADTDGDGVAELVVGAVGCGTICQAGLPMDRQTYTMAEATAELRRKFAQTTCCCGGVLSVAAVSQTSPVTNT